MYCGTMQFNLRHSGKISASTKNGIQQPTKTPVIIAKVLAALRSRFESSGPFLFFLFLHFGDWTWAWVLDVGSVPISVSKSLTFDLVGWPELPLVPVVAVVIFVVVPSVIVGNGCPMALITAVAMRPVCPGLPTKPVKF